MKNEFILALSTQQKSCLEKKQRRYIQKFHYKMIVVRARINHMGKDITNQLVEKLRGREYGLQLDEATDSNKDAHLICYVRFFDDNSMIDDLLFSKPIMTRATSKNLFQILNSFITEHNIE